MKNMTSLARKIQSADASNQFHEDMLIYFLLPLAAHKPPLNIYPLTTNKYLYQSANIEHQHFFAFINPFAVGQTFFY